MDERCRIDHALGTNIAAHTHIHTHILTHLFERVVIMIKTEN